MRDFYILVKACYIQVLGKQVHTMLIKHIATNAVAPEVMHYLARARGGREGGKTTATKQQLGVWWKIQRCVQEKKS